MEQPTMGTTLDEILAAFKLKSNQLAGIQIVEADVVGGNLRFRMQGNGKLGVVIGGLWLREAKPDELAELDDAIELGQAQIYTTPLYVSGRTMTKTVLHQATGNPLDPSSPAARKQRERLERAYPTAVLSAARAYQLDPAVLTAIADAESGTTPEAWTKIVPDDLGTYPLPETVVIAQVQHWRTQGIQEHRLIRVVEDDVTWRTADDRSEFDERNWSVIAWRKP